MSTGEAMPHALRPLFVALASILLGLGLLLAVGWPVDVLRVSSDTLAPTLASGDRVVVLRGGLPWLWTPERGDIVVFPAPPSTGDRAGDGFIKRIAGLPGERVAVREGRLYVDGEAVPEPWRAEGDAPGVDQPPLRVPDGQLFVLGDRRGLSYDSRHWGLLALDRVDGVALRSLGD